ncbi:MAG: glycosyltransferase family 9 protein [Nitrospira sp.]|jgi:heptosyltransferase-1|nr:glycosyltransferase family 9 protein [Nitrospira sp.]
MKRILVVQLARLGDLVQSMPVLAALRARHPQDRIDLLCPAQLRDLAGMIPGIDRVMGWDGTVWQQWASQAATGIRRDQLRHIEAELAALCSDSYDRAYVLNQHPRAILAGALLAQETVGPLADGPLSERLTPWAAYIREIATTRKTNHVHLSDAFCGLCGVVPPGQAAHLQLPATALPADLERIGQEGTPWIGLIVGAGDQARQIPAEVWRTWIVQFLNQASRGRVVLIGQGAERERARQIQDALPASLQGRVWDVTGRTTVPELAVVLSRCQRVIGSDTGPLHVAAAVGTPVIGWYIARARVHETGPYGPGHIVWQAESPDGGLAVPTTWPIESSLDALLNRPPAALNGWSIWMSQADARGTYYTKAGEAAAPPRAREAIWQELHRAVAA